MATRFTISAGPNPGSILLYSCVLALLSWPQSVRADWPVPRGDVARTGTVEGTGALKSQVVSWRHYLGGAIVDRSAQLYDVDDDGALEVIFVSGGALVAKERNDLLRWQTPVFGISTIVGIHDLDGDGTREIAARSSSRVFIVELASGRILWKSPADDLSSIDDVRIGDLDGDGVDDLVAQVCPCCRVSISGSGYAYRFSAGFSASATSQRMWALPDTSCGGRYSMTLIDANGDGRQDITYSNSTGIGVIDGTTGRGCLDGATPCEPCLARDGQGACALANPEHVAAIDLGARSNASQCMAADVDGRKGQELLCLQNNSSAERPEDAHRMFALTYEPATQESAANWRLLWQQNIGTRARAVALGTRSLVDLDGDGSLEIVASGVLDSTELWVTYVLDTATGRILGSISEQRIVGVVDLGRRGGPHRQTLLTSRDDGLWAWSFDRQATPSIRGQWSLPGHTASVEPDRALTSRTYAAGRIASVDVTGDDRPELVLVDTQSGRLTAYDMTEFTPRPVAEYALDSDHELLELWTTTDHDDDTTALFIATTDGVMHALDSAFAVQTEGLKFGGYYPKGDWRNLDVTPVTANLGTGADSVIIADARRALIRLDAQNADASRPPTVTWIVPRTSSPIVLPNLNDGEPAIACRQTLEDGSHALQLLSVDGDVRRSVAINGERDARLLSDIVPANLDDDGVPDLIVQWAEPGDLALHIEGFSGTALQSLWHTVPPYEGTTRFPAGGAVVDWDRDGIDDFVHQYYRTQIISGANGDILSQTEQNGIYFMPIVTQLDDDPAPELVLQGGYNSIRALDDDLSALWTSEDDSRPYPYGSLVHCGDGASYLIEGSLAQPATLRRTRVDIDGTVDGQTDEAWSRVLAHGRMYGSVSDTTLTDVFLGQLTSTVVHNNLMGDERPIVLVGSEDGYLYAVDACSGGLVFTMPFGASVGAIAFGDTDGDDIDEVLVAVADGYLYAIDDDGTGYKVGCQCDAGAPTNGTWWLVVVVTLALRRRRPDTTSNAASGQRRP